MTSLTSLPDTTIRAFPTTSHIGSIVASTTYSPHFNTVHTTGGTVINIAGSYYSTTPDGLSSIPPPEHTNYTPAGAISRHFSGRSDELFQINRVFCTASHSRLRARFAVYGEAGIGKTQLVLQYASRAHAEKRYNHIFHISALSIAHIQEGLLMVFRLLHPSDYQCAENVAVQRALRWMEESPPEIPWLMVVDHVSPDTVDFLKTHLSAHICGDIIFTMQSKAYAQTLADKAVIQLGPLAHDDAILLLLRRAEVIENVTSIEKAREIVQQLGCLPVPICQAGSYAKYFGKANLGSLSPINQKGDLTISKLLRWDTELTNYEHRTYENIIESQCANLATCHPQALGLLIVLSFLHPSGILLPILINGACLSQSGSERTLEQVNLTTLRNLRPHSSEPLHPINVLLDMLCSRTELHNLIRHLEHFSLVRLEVVNLTTHPTDCDPVYLLCISDLARQTVREKMGQSDEGSAYFGLAVEIMVTVFLHSKSGDLAQEQYIQHIATLALSDLDHGVISSHRRTALCYAIEKLVEMERAANPQSYPSLRMLDESLSSFNSTGSAISSIPGALAIIMLLRLAAVVSRHLLYRYGSVGHANTDISALMERLAISGSFNQPKSSLHTDAPADTTFTSLLPNTMTGSAVPTSTNGLRATNYRLINLMDRLLPLASPNLVELVAPCIRKLKEQFLGQKPKIHSLREEKQRRAASQRFKNSRYQGSMRDVFSDERVTNARRGYTVRRKRTG